MKFPQEDQIVLLKGGKKNRDVSLNKCLELQQTIFVSYFYCTAFTHVFVIFHYESFINWASKASIICVFN